MNENNNLLTDLPGPDKSDGTEINLMEIFHLLKSKILFIIAAAVIFAGVAGIYSKFFISPQYRAKASIYVDAEYTEAEATLALTVTTNLAKDYPYIIKSNSVMNEVSKRLGLGVTGASLVGAIDVSMPGNDDESLRVLDIYVTYSSPEGAAQIANTIVEVSKEKISGYAEYSKIKIKVIDEAEIPGGAVSPNVMRNAFVAAVLGAVLVAAMFIIISIMDDKLKTEADIEKYLGLNMLAAIPDYSESENKNKIDIKGFIKSKVNDVTSKNGENQSSNKKSSAKSNSVKNNAKGGSSK